MAGMLDPENFNKEVQDRRLKLVIDGMGPLSEKSAFILALMIKQSDDPLAYMNSLSASINAIYGAGSNHASDSTFAEMSTMYRQACSIYLEIKDI